MTPLLILILVTLSPPEASLNDRVLEFARSKLGQTVGDGQCTALAAEALRHAGAVRSGRGWGEELVSLAEVRPGDILQFDGVTFVRHVVRADIDGAVVTLNFTMPHLQPRLGRDGGGPAVRDHQNAGFEGANRGRAAAARNGRSTRPR